MYSVSVAQKLTKMDFLKRDGKNIVGENNSVVFGLSRLVACTVSVTLFTPIAVVGGILSLPYKLLLAPKRTTPGFPPVERLVDLPATTEREFDVVVFGATGYTGQLVAKYLAKQYGNSKVKFALAGRRAQALEQVKTECLASNPQAEITVVSGVDSFNAKSLQEMTRRTKVVVSTVGPFQLYGTPLVVACIATQTHYCDITGEVDWYSELVEHYHDQARDAGVSICSFCGHDSVPWDLLTYKLAQKLLAGGETLTTVHVEDEILAGPSGGTVATILETIRAGLPAKSKLGFSPLLLGQDGRTKSTFTTKDISPVLPRKASRGWNGPFVMSMVNAQVVARSNALNEYGSKVEYSESRLARNFAVLMGRYLELVAVGPALFLPHFLQQYLLPQPGTGPSTEQLEQGFLQLTGTAMGSKGSKVQARLYFDHDMGYVGTARLLVECGLCLAEGSNTQRRGVVTPASCFPDQLLDRLLSKSNKGTEFAYLQ
ncbi:hypothetical protein BASA81_006342 [Batrachochytrium salamandrivorans]|nr:hypothetical protein BASA81_006342 [Batrachochytrium salamandrivorans]